MKKVEIEDILKYRYPDGLIYNPSGSAFAYNLGYADKKKNTYKKDVWAVRDGEPFRLTSTIDASIAFWESDSELIINRKKPGDEKEEGTELFSISLNGGEACLWAKFAISFAEIKKVSEGVYAATGQIDVADPDAYLDDDETREKKKKEKEENLEKDYDVYTEVPYWINGAGKQNGKRNALFIIRRVAGAEAEADKRFEVKRVTEPGFNVESFKVEGNKVYFTGGIVTPIPDYYNDLFVCDVAAGKVEALYDRHDASFFDYHVFEGEVYAFAADYKRHGINESPYLFEVKDKALSRIEGYEPTYSRYNSVVCDTALAGGRENKLLKEGDEPVLYTISTIDDHTAITSIRLRTGEVSTLLELPGIISFFDIVKDKFALCHTDSATLPEIYTADKADMVLKPVSDHNRKALEDTYVALPNRVDYTSEGLELHGFVLLPEDFDENRKFPAVLDVHGGPRCVYSEAFFHEMQVWVAKGYIVMFTNIKGSDGRGDDFADIRGGYGGTDFKNLMAFVDAVLDKYPQIDTSRICETGGSYGGFMTNWIVTHTDRFCCAATQRSISNWISMSYISDIGPIFGPDQCGIEYEDCLGKMNEEVLWDHSPLKYVDNAKTPMLFLHSDEDYRCPLAEAMQMMQAMTVRGVETRMIVFKGENHDLSRSGKPMHRIRRLNEITDWFNRNTAS
jgi:dipeptidyl aminopeptidase/acylaminoacyl peptidase